MFQVGELRTSRGSFTPRDLQLIHKYFGSYRKQGHTVRMQNIKSTLAALDQANDAPAWTTKFLSGRGDIAKRIFDKLRAW